MDNKQIAKEVIDALGGRENVNSVAHCATRLRVMVKDENKINKEKAENIEKVQGAFFNSGQYQMIFGTGTVNKIYDEVVAQGLPTASKDEQKAEAAKQGNWFQRAIRSFGDVFVPLLPAIVATGLFMGIRGAINNDTVLGLFGTTSKAFAATDFYTYTVVLTDTAFAFFPALICWSAFNVFGGSPLLGLVLGLMMVNNALPNAWDVASGAAKPIYFFDFIPVVGYQNSVLPAFFVGLLGAKFEQWEVQPIPEDKPARRARRMPQTGDDAESPQKGDSWQHKGDTVTLFMNGGRMIGLRPKDIAGLFYNTVEMEKGAVGDIRIFPKHSLIEVDASVAPLLLEALATATVCGYEVNVREDKGAPEYSGTPRSSRRNGGFRNSYRGERDRSDRSGFRGNRGGFRSDRGERWGERSRRDDRKKRF